MTTINNLLDLPSLHGGWIVSTASLSEFEIIQARASNRMFVRDDSLGFVWVPDIKRIPETETEVKFLEQWYPVEVALPESLKQYRG